VTKPPNQAPSSDVPFALQIIASDPEGEPLTYSADDLPPGLSIGATTGLISGTIPASAAGLDFLVSVNASDGVMTASRLFWIDVAPL